METEMAIQTDTINVILVDDHQIIRDGIKAFLKEDNDINIVGEADNGKQLLQLVAENQPDLVLMDINMPEMDGYEATKILHEQFPDVKILILSMLDHEKYVSKMLHAGASGYILKNSGKDELLCGIRLVSKGHKYICSDLAFTFLNKLHRDFSPELNSIAAPKKVADLSQREIEVLKLIAEGLTNAEIADKLFTSKRTIESHRQNIIEKTQVKNTASLIKYAITNGIIN
jgi:DNA-binding NarL/FixJ family response regulator